MNLSPILTALLLSNWLISVFSAKIVFLFAGGNLSHKLFIWPLVMELADRGHQITFYSSSPKQLQSHPNVTDIAPAQLVQATAETFGLDRFQLRAEGKDHVMIDGYMSASLAMCQTIMTSSDPDLVNMVENGDYDLAIVNSIFGECGVLIAQYHKWKYIYVSANTVMTWFQHIYGVPVPLSYIPEITGKFDYPMGFYGRFVNLLRNLEWGSRGAWYNEEMEALMKQRFNLTSVPSFTEMERDASLILYNSHHALDFARALPPMCIPVGGMQCLEKIGTMGKNFQDFMDNAEDGVILISFGSTVLPSSMSPHFRSMFYSMMRKFSRVRFIWRWTGEVPENAPLNLMGTEWFPQKEILKHPKLRAFMSHCGLNSIIEATCSGVPVICVPLFGDQDFNAYRLIAQELGVMLELNGMTQDRMDRTVEKLLSNPKYKENMGTRSRILKDQPLSPVDTAVYWTEFVLRHNDTSSFKLMSLEQPDYVRHMLDVYAAILFVFIVLPLMLMYLVIMFIRKMTFKSW